MLRVVCILVLASCAPKHAPEPVAPKVTPGPAKLVYAPDAFAGKWKITAHFATPAGASDGIDVTASVVMRLAKASPDTLDVYFDQLEIHGGANESPVDVTISATDPKHAADLKAALDRIVIHTDGPGEATKLSDSALAKQGADLVETALFLIPSLPNVPVGGGTRWTANRVVPKNHVGPELKTEIRYVLDRFVPCNKAQCASIKSTADTGMRELEVDGQAFRVHYTLQGEAEVQLAGAPLRSDAKLTLRIETAAATIDLAGTLTCRRL